jgi:ribonucleoside-triphosphate reductase
MRNLEVIENELAAAREALSSVKGTPAEVYSRIVGYYRSVRNWNKGKREEYGERVMFKSDPSLLAACRPQRTETAAQTGAAEASGSAGEAGQAGKNRVLLFVRPTCPNCPSAKDAAGQLGIPLELYDADTDEGLAEARRRNVLSTPTAILLSSTGEELGRARNVETIAQLSAAARQPVAV